MKKLIFSVAMTFTLAALAADPNPFSDYKMAMASDAQHPMAVEWQAKNAEAIAAATEKSVLAAHVADAQSADLLLGQLRGAYETDPLVMTQIGAVTMWVLGEEPCWLEFWAPSPAAGREVWKAALQRKLAGSQDAYVRTFCRQQLDLCE